MKKTTELAHVSLDDLHVMLDKGNKAKALMLENPFMRDVVIKALEEELNALEQALYWAPGQTESTVEKIALDRVYKSGIAHGIGALWRVINTLRRDGEKAEKEMGLRGG